jgi:16S rRNA (cytosine967-C5)-methyltransferase
MPSAARRIAFEILLRVETQRAYAADLLHGSLPQSLEERDAALCTELVLGTLRWQRMLDFIAQHFTAGRWFGFDLEVQLALRLGLYQLRFLTRMPAHAAVHETVELVKAAGKKSAAGLVNAVLRKGGEADLASLRPAEMSDLDWCSIEYSHPHWLMERWCSRYGNLPSQALASADNQPSETYFRPSLLSANLDAIRQSLHAEGVETRPGVFLSSCLAVERGNLARTQLFRNGEIIVQDEASQIVPYLLDAKRGQSVLDLCAAPGNKTGMVAQWVGRDGLVVAGDRHLHRLRQMQRFPANTNVTRLALDGAQALPFTTLFDRILVDAPCSGTGTLRRNPEIKWRLEPSDIGELAEAQLRLLGNAANVLKTGGRLVYSTCSLEPEEDQGVVSRFLEGYPEFRLLPLCDDAARLRAFFHEEAVDRLLKGEFLETSPARDATDGFFAAILVKREQLR